MANKISQLTSAGALAGTEAVWVETNPGASGLPRKTTTQDIADLASGGLTGGTVTDSTLRWNGTAWVENTTVKTGAGGLLTLTLGGQPAIDFTSTGGPIGIRFSAGKATSAQVDLVYRTTPEVLYIERVSDGADIAAFDPSNLSTTLSSLNVGAITATGTINANAGIAFDNGTDAIAGIQNQNLLDKSTAETVSGNWTWSGSGTMVFGNGTNAMPNTRFISGTTIGGWARGWSYTDSTQATIHGGIGALGSNDTLTHFAIGYGSTWYNAGNSGLLIQNRQGTMDGNFTLTGLGADGDIRLIVEADSDNLIETANAELWLTQDGRGVNAYYRTTDTNGVEIGSSTGLGTFTNPIFSWAYNSDTVECHGPLNYTGINVHDGVNTFIRYNNDGWGNAPLHDVLKNSYTVTTGDIMLIKAAGNSTGSHGILGVGDNGLFWGRTDQETSLTITNSNTPFDNANYFRVDTTSTIFAHAIELDTEERVLYGTANGARVQVGSDGNGHSGVFGSTQHTDAASLDYRTYWAYDAYWDDVNNQWAANRTTLGKKWVAEMGYHQDSFTIRRFDGTVSSPWADSAWSTFFTVKNDGEVEIQSAGGSEMLTLKDAGGSGIAADPFIAFRDSGNTRIGYVGVGSSLTNDVYLLSDSGSIQLTAGSGTIEVNDILDMNGNNINDAGRIYLDALYMNETSAAQSDVAGDGQLWTKSNAPTDLYFTTDNGLDYPVAYARYRVTADTTLDGANVSETLGVQHINGVWYSDNATAYTLTLQDNTVTTFPVGAQMTIWNEGSGTLTINEGASTTLYLLTGSAVTDTAGGCTMGQGGYATLIRKSTTVYLIMGSGITP